MQRKVNRLSKINYNIDNIYYLTICCHDRSNYFIENSVVDLCLGDIREVIKRFNAKLWAYCFMSDHLHLLVETNKCGEFVKLFKQTTAYKYKQKYNNTLWQKSYYDHVLRNQEDLVTKIGYIFNNPVRAGLVKNYLDYPYSGSFEINIKDFVET